MISAMVWLLATGQPVMFEERKGDVEACTSVPAAKVSLKTADMLVLRSTAFVA